MHRNLAIALLAIISSALFVRAEEATEPAAESTTPAAEAQASQSDVMRFLRDVPKPEPVTPPEATDIESAITRGVDFLLETQNPDGSWGSAMRTKALNIYAPVPGAHDGYRLATTALGIWAMIDVNDPRPEALAALERAEAHLIEKLPDLKRSSSDVLYNVWGHAYGIQALVRMRARLPEDAERIEKIDALIRHQIDMLERFASVDGGWGYYDFNTGSQRPGSSSSSFTTATVLVALAEARDIGIESPRPMVDAAIAALKRQQKPDFTYLYGEYLKMRPMGEINRPEGSLGRSQACNLALRMWGDEQITDDVVEAWLNWLYAKDEWLSVARKRPRPHESWYAIAGYFYYYAHLYSAMNIHELPEAERQPFKNQEAHILLELQEKDGSWWDFPLYDYHQQYGTAMALLSLSRCR